MTSFLNHIEQCLKDMGLSERVSYTLGRMNKIEFTGAIQESSMESAIFGEFLSRLNMECINKDAPFQFKAYANRIFDKVDRRRDYMYSQGLQ